MAQEVPLDQSPLFRGVPPFSRVSRTRSKSFAEVSPGTWRIRLSLARGERYGSSACARFTAVKATVTSAAIRILFILFIVFSFFWQEHPAGCHPLIRRAVRNP